MSYRFLEDVAIADVAFEARGKTIAELFQEAARAVTNIMVLNPGAIEAKVMKTISIDAENAEMLLFHFLEELIFLKDAEQLLFGDFEVRISHGKTDWQLRGVARGEMISPERHALIVDVKGVSLHNLSVEATDEGWRAAVIVDV